ncbi:complement receptor type 1-like [Ranitomeya variabilis]|uniref:complement receptor type 1-like n=1 Tax=Ranitomeya variabilis TaxID=490064 RepID=UPI0040570558
MKLLGFISSSTLLIVLFLANFTVRSHAQAASDLDIDGLEQDISTPCSDNCFTSFATQDQQTNGDNNRFTGFCRTPPDILFAELSEEFLEESIFSIGTTVRYRCQTGYSPSPGTDVAVTCLTDGTWSFPHSFCKYDPKSESQKNPKNTGFCSSPPDIPFAELSEEFSKQTVFSKDTTVTLNCQTGYSPTPGHILTATCLSDGTWFSDTVCGRICRSPPDIPYAELKDDILKQVDFLPGGIASYKCKSGFVYIPGAKDFVTCVDGKWSTNDFFCTPKACGFPPRLEYGLPRDEDLERTLFSVGTKIMYVCRPGYTKIPGKSALVTCMDDSTWSPPNVFCKRRSCGNPGEAENGQMQAENLDFGSRVTYTCNRGYKMTTKRNYRDCQANGAWSNQVPVCEVQICEAPFPILNGHYYPEKEEYSYLDSVRYVCSGNLQIIGDHNMFCKEDGTWSSDAPECKSVQCSDPHVYNAYKVSGYSGPYLMNSAVRFSCRPQYVLIGSDVVKCNQSSKWEPELPKCVGVCQFLPRFKYAEIVEPTNESRFLEGTELKYKCKEGYELAPGAVATVTCSGFKWSPSTEFCTPKLCVEPEPTPNGRIIAGSLSFGTRITYICDIGYTMKSLSYRECLSNQSWSLPIPECEVQTCLAPEWSNNGWIEPEKQQYFYNDTISFGCHEGYKLIGQDIITCNHDGRWNYKEPECRGICKDPPTLDYAILDIQNKPTAIYVVGNKVQYKCRCGYVRNTVNKHYSITCLENSEWSDIPKAFCNRRSCGHPPAIKNAISDAKDFLFDSKAVYKCEKGYKTDSPSNSIKCESNGRWNGTLPVCTVQKCSPPEDLENGSYSLKKNEYLYGETVTYKCNTLQLVGKASVSCTDEGKWSSSAPQCRDACTSPPELPFAAVDIEVSNPEYADREESLQYKCRPGFVPVSGSNNKITCLENLKWSQYDIFCRAISCGHPGQIDNGEMQYDHFSFGSRVNYTCNPGYSMISKRNYRECQADGTWSGKPPVCKEPVCDQIWELQEEARKCTSTPDEWIKYLQVQYLYHQIENLKLDNEIKKKLNNATVQISSTSDKKNQKS